MLDKIISEKISQYKILEKDEHFLEDLKAVEHQGKEDELYERFYTELEFGTGGIRGIIEAGTNRLNTLVVQQVADGWARYLQSEFKDERAIVVIAYDSRHFSEEFSLRVTEVLSYYGVKVYSFSSPRPTPQLSFTIRQMQAHSGLVITASHNPPEYNGLKIYWRNGEQVVPPHDLGIMKSVEESKTRGSISKLTLEEARSQGLYEILDESYDRAFCEYVDSVLTNKKVFELKDDFKLVYTPLHGTGAVHLSSLFEKYQVNAIIEPSQKEPNGDFPTVEYPNPEEPKALQNAISSATNIGAQLVVATDPDADRMGLAEKIGDKFVCLTGNQIGVLLLEYILNFKEEAGQLGTKSVFINTIVTSTLQEKIAKAYGVETRKTYTGFKNIAEAMALIEMQGENFVFACEESYGYLASMSVRDKDGISITMLAIEMAKYYFSQGKTLSYKLEEIFERYGYHKEKTLNIVLEGSSGKEKISSIMDKFRANPPHSLGNDTLEKVYDYQAKTITSHDGAQLGNIEGFSHRSNVLILYTGNGNRICIRPSGTEPKIKIYFLFQTTQSLSNEEAVEQLDSDIQAAEQSLQEWMK